MHAFDYVAPTTLAEAIELLSAKDSARLLAGGTDLIDQMRTGRYRPDHVIDIKKIDELNVLVVNDSGLRVGAATPCYRIYGEPLVPAQYSALADACHIIGGIQIQSRASVGGNLCNSGPAADSTPAMIALDGSCRIAGPSGERTVPVADFCTGPGANVLGSNELLVDVQFPAPAPNTGSHYRRMIPRNEMDIAVVGVGARVELDAAGETIVSARIGLGAVAPTPLFAQEASNLLAGAPAEEASYAKAAEAAQATISPITDMRGTKEYRTHVTGVLVRRVLAAAVARARGETIDYHAGH